MNSKSTSIRKAIKTGAKAKYNALPVENINDLYSHLAVSIIIQAFDDLKWLDGEDRGVIEQCTVSQAEIMNFFRSGWAALLMSCQHAVTQEGLVSAAKSFL